MTAPLRIQGIEIHVDGPAEGTPADTVVMLHGWPDTWRLWDRQVPALAPQRRCVRFTLPGFDLAGPRGAWTVDAIVSFVDQVIDATSPDAPVVLMLHDWGCIFGYEVAMRRPERVSRIVGVDIGDARSARHMRSLGPLAKAMIAGYQLFLAAAWRLGPTLGDPMTRWLAPRIGCKTDPATIDSRMNYPYDMAWTGSHGGLRLRPFVPPCPYFYAYGAKKLFQFHSPEWEREIAVRPGCRTQAFATGHWVVRSDAVGFNAAVVAWLDATAAVARRPVPS